MSVLLIIVVIVVIIIGFNFLDKQGNKGVSKLTEKYLTAEKLFFKENYSEAIQILTEIISSYPFYQYYGLRGSCYFQLKNFPMALKDYEMSISMKPDIESNNMAYLRRDECKMKLNELRPIKNPIINVPEKKALVASGSVGHCIEKDGVKLVFEGLKALNREMKDFFKRQGTFDLREEKIELEILLFSFYLLKLKNENTAAHDLLFNNVVSFYSDIASAISNTDPMIVSPNSTLFINKSKYIADKVSNYQDDLTAVKIDINFSPKYCFASLFMFPMADASLLQERSMKIEANNIVAFKVGLLGALKMMEAVNENFSKYVNVQR